MITLIGLTALGLAAWYAIARCLAPLIGRRLKKNGDQT